MAVNKPELKKMGGSSQRLSSFNKLLKANQLEFENEFTLVHKISSTITHRKHLSRQRKKNPSCKVVSENVNQTKLMHLAANKMLLNIRVYIPSLQKCLYRLS